MKVSKCSLISLLMATIYIATLLSIGQTEARSLAESQRSSTSDGVYADQEAASAVIPSPNQAFDDEISIQAGDIIRKSSGSTIAQSQQQQQTNIGNQANGASPVPVYVSQYLVPEKFAGHQQESSQPSVDFASRADQSQAIQEPSRPKDLKVAASYGHGHHGKSHHGGHHYGGHHAGSHDEHHGKGGHHYDNHGWLDMGAYTGKKGSFGWHADFPVGGKHGYGR